jgi:hypothetical protein
MLNIARELTVNSHLKVGPSNYTKIIKRATKQTKNPLVLNGSYLLYITALLRPIINSPPNWCVCEIIP